MPILLENIELVRRPLRVQLSRDAADRVQDLLWPAPNAPEAATEAASDDQEPLDEATDDDERPSD